MYIILNESEWAKEALDGRSLGRKPSETLRHIARYYLSGGYKKQAVKKKLEEFIASCDPTASIPKWSSLIEYATNKASKEEIISIECVEITKPEMAKIDAITSVQERRLAFTLLCLAKYLKAINPSSDFWVNIKDNEIMSMANINTSIKRQCQMFRNLKDAGLIKFSKKVDNTNVRVNFVEDGDVALKIYDFRNLGYQYLMYNGQPYFECESCGIITKRSNPTRGARQKYCVDCAQKIAIKQRVESVMRYREKASFCNC